MVLAARTIVHCLHGGINPRWLVPHAIVWTLERRRRGIRSPSQSGGESRGERFWIFLGFASISLLPYLAPGSGCRPMNRRHLPTSSNLDSFEIAHTPCLSSPSFALVVDLHLRIMTERFNDDTGVSLVLGEPHWNAGLAGPRESR